MENKKKWYRTNLGIILLLVFFFPAGLFLMWKYAGWNKKVKWIITSLFAFVIFISLIPGKPVKNNSSIKQAVVSITATPTSVLTQNPSTKPVATPKFTSKPTSSPASTVKPTDKPSSSVLKKIEEIAGGTDSKFEVTVWNKNSELASEGEVPYEVILNGSFNKTIASSCDGAKRLSYYMLEAFYKDNEIRPTLSRVMITIPYYLRVSLGASDGVPMAQDGGFSGPTNFWTVVEKAGLGENENGDMKNRSWATYLTKCE